MRDYVRVVRAVWTSWQTRAPLAFESEHYRLNLMVPLFDPGPSAQPDIPIHIAVVSPYMCGVAGEVADGLRPHPVCTAKYIREVMLPRGGGWRRPERDATLRRSRSR
jgi:alkanesulfonate monooxygenase SsuD/methylene tetrahydromethanopterin reductase-like flavin-dependent oxidoreductase (luciferase family)